MDIYEMLLMGGDPAQQQLAQAQALRSKKQLNEAMQSSGNEARQMELLNFAATAAGNNPNLAAATGALAKSAGGRSLPRAIGQGGVAIGDQYLENPDYVEQKGADRQTRLLTAASALEGRRESSELRRQTAIDAEAGRMERAGMMVALRQALGGAAAERKSEKDAAAAAKAAKGKTMPAGQAMKIGTAELTRDDYGRLVESFKDDFSGMPAVAGAQNAMGKYGVNKYRDQSNWWQNYTEQSNRVRHELFGSALTANEQKAFEAATIMPGMDTKEIRRRLGQQHRAAAMAHAKIIQSLGKAGYDVENFDTSVPEAALPGGKNEKKRVKIDINGNIVP